MADAGRRKAVENYRCDMSYSFVPRRMRAPTAAAYLDVSESTFLDRVARGTYPPGVRDGGVRVWLRDDLDEMIDRQFKVTARAGANDIDDPFAARFDKAS
tara:strand:- start:1107 stop:1406 length:300 start_codon:yes stop_codon:yes gene_type:complete